MNITDYSHCNNYYIMVYSIPLFNTQFYVLYINNIVYQDSVEAAPLNLFIAHSHLKPANAEAAYTTSARGWSLSVISADSTTRPVTMIRYIMAPNMPPINGALIYLIIHVCL
jgi:hypothetical protein